MNFKLRKIKAVILCAAVLTIAGTVTVFAGNASSGSVAANYILGDADGDGNVTINDVTCIQTSIAELPLRHVDPAVAGRDDNALFDR